ncbi:MAG: beta strand repeat-containing protein, partial [Ilumatobacteraceae bacterium]
GISTLGVTSTTNLTSQQLNVSGITTLGVTSTTNLTSQQLLVTGVSTLASIVGTSLSISGISTLGVTSTTNLTSQQLNVSGITTLGVTSTTNLTSQQLLVTGITTLSSIVGTSLSISGITTLGVTSTTNLTTRQLNVSGVSTFNNIVGTSLSITGISTIANFRITNVGTGATVGGIGVVTYYGDGSNLTNVVASSGYASTAGIATNVIGGIGSITQLQVTGISTFINGPVLIGTGTSTGTAGQVLQVSGINSSVYIGGNVGIGTTIPTSKLHVIGDVRVSGVVTATTFVGNLTGIASTASSVTPDSVGLGTDTFGDYVKDIDGTIGEIVVTGGTGEGSSPIISFALNPTIGGNVTIGNDLQVNNNLNVTGNITVGGTSATLFTQTLRVADKDIVLGITTDPNGNDVSNDTTANHGGIAIASTEGNPLVTLTNPGIGETLPATYKKFMWFKAGSFGIGTDAWLSNYAIGIGSTQFPTGTRLAAGSVQFTENDLAVVKNINSTGIITATEFKGTLTGYASSAGIATNLYGGVAGNIPYQSNTNTTTFVDNSSATPDQVLLWNGSAPAWGNISAGSIVGDAEYAEKAG